MKSVKITIYRILYGIAVFVACLILFSHILQHRDTASAEEMPAPSLPIVTMRSGKAQFNELHGFTDEREPSEYRAVMTPLSPDRKVSAQIQPFGEAITALGFEVRTLTGSRLIESSDITDTKTNADGTITVNFTLKDLIDEDEEYLLDLRLATKGQPDVRYYTRIRCDFDDTLYRDAVAFAEEFHAKTIEGTDTAWLSDYIEPDETGSGTSLADVNINSSIDLVTFGELTPKDVTEPVYSLMDEDGATFLLHGSAILSAEDPDDETRTCYYDTQEYYRIYKGFDRFHLLDYKRTMTQIYDPEAKSYANDRLDLGIAGTDQQVVQSADGVQLAFVDGGRLYSVNVDESSIAYIYAFSDAGDTDIRAAYPEHGIRILSVQDDGGIDFVVYGYMNRGKHEGRMGIVAYHYNPAYRTIEEQAFISFGGSFDRLRPQVENAAYLNADGKLYLMLEDVLYEIDIREHRVQQVASSLTGTNDVVAEGGRMVAWTETDTESDAGEGSIVFTDLSDLSQQVIRPESGETLTPIGFLGDDLIYGVSRESDASTDATGMEFLPMYSVRITDHDRNILEEYSVPDYYISEAVIEANQITLHRVQKVDGVYTPAADDQIVSAAVEDGGSALLQTADGGSFGTVVRLQATGFDPEDFRYIRPKEVMYEGSREFTTDSTGNAASDHAEMTADGEDAKTGDAAQQAGSGAASSSRRFYLYGTYGFERYYYDEADAVRRASEEPAIVLDDHGSYVWRAARADRCELENVGSGREYLAALQEGTTTAVNACLDAMLRYEGVTADVDGLLSAGADTASLLEEQLPGSTALDLTGCTMDEILYYPTADTPVLALTHGGERAVLIIGYGPEKIAVWDPYAQEPVTLLSRESAKSLFAGGGNRYLTYVKPER